MDEVEILLNVAKVVLVYLAGKAASRVQERRQSRRARRRLRCNPWILRHVKQGVYPNLCQELPSEDTPAFVNFACFAPQGFEELLTMVTPLIARKNTHFRDSISCCCNVAVCLKMGSIGPTFSNSTRPDWR